MLAVNAGSLSVPRITSHPLLPPRTCATGRDVSRVWWRHRLPLAWQRPRLRRRWAGTAPSMWVPARLKRSPRTVQVNTRHHGRVWRQQIRRSKAAGAAFWLAVRSCSNNSQTPTTDEENNGLSNNAVFATETDVYSMHEMADLISPKSCRASVIFNGCILQSDALCECILHGSQSTAYFLSKNWDATYWPLTYRQ